LLIDSLDNGGAGKEITFTAKVINGLTVTVTGVSSATQNVALAELEVFGIPASLVQYNLVVDAAPSGSGVVLSTRVKRVIVRENR
jgi:hypothetical protein